MSTPNAILPPAPYLQPFVDSHGVMTSIWANWFKQLYRRAGQANAPSNSDIVNNSSALTALQATVATLQSSVTTLNSQVAAHTTSITTHTNQINSLGVGRQL